MLTINVFNYAWCYDMVSVKVIIGSAKRMSPDRCQAITLTDADSWSVITLRPRQNGRHFADNIFKCIFLNENAWISLMISLKFVPKVPINNIRSLVQIMAWRRPGAKPLSEPMMVSLLTHICVTRPQWVKEHISMEFYLKLRMVHSRKCI